MVNSLWFLPWVPCCIVFSFSSHFLFSLHPLSLTGVIETLSLVFLHLPSSFAHQGSSGATFVATPTLVERVFRDQHNDGSVDKGPCLAAWLPELDLRGPTRCQGRTVPCKLSCELHNAPSKRNKQSSKQASPALLVRGGLSCFHLLCP